ncbi:hypothetical protein BV22DRAFT_577822 [Leucogyrophana mollusca]|uniref:Uncharacterized protein n=1 Tax=Leucogyrophana mollusca TaxID=85980 RepID=A0ACB8BDJ6_9AGAM|nr:hypothetical protein BV22DRAFT_577822 [Leucogyrophana mollusca]
MKVTLFFARYVAFGFFVICNAIVCSVAVWNYSLAQSAGQALQVDVYLIFVGAVFLVFIFPVIFADLICTNPFTGRVWFECAWLVLFWALELAGAAAVTAITSNMFCDSGALNVTVDSCTSTRVLLAFSWICTVIMLLYLLLLILTAASCQRENPAVWQADIGELNRATARQCLPSAPNSPVLPRFKKRPPPEIFAPQPRRPSETVKAMYTHRAGLSSDYEIEHFNPPFPAAEQLDYDVPSSVPEAKPALSLTLPAPALIHTQPQRSPLSRSPDAGPRTSVSFFYPNQVQSSIPFQLAPPSPPSPPPLGEWPKQNALKEPTRVKRKPPPPSAFEFPSKRVTLPASELPPASTSYDPLLHPRKRRPSGPRMRTPSNDDGQRPPPLDLSRVHSYDVSRSY